MPVLVICMFDKDPIKMNELSWRQMSNTGFSSTQGQVTPIKIVGSGPNSNSSEILYPACKYQNEAAIVQTP